MSKANNISIPMFIGTVIETCKYILSKTVILLVIGTVAGIVGIAYAWFTPPMYVSEIAFVAEGESGGQFKGYAGIAAQFGLDLGSSSNGAFDGDNLIEFLKSKKIIVATLLSDAPDKKGLLIDQFIKNNEIDLNDAKFQAGGKVSFEKDRLNNSRQEDSLLNAIAKSIMESQLSISRREKKLNFINLRFQSNNEVFSKTFADVLIRNTISSYSEYKIRKVKQNVDILQKQADSVRAILTGNVADVNSITDLNINPAKQKIRSPIQNKQIDLQVNSVLYTELLKNLEISKLALRKETPLIQIIDGAEYPLKKEKLGRLKTGLLFSIAAVAFAITVILVKKWYKDNKDNTANNIVA